MSNFLKSQALCILNMPGTKAVVFPHDGKIPFIAAIKVIGKIFFSCSWKEKLNSCWFMLLRPETVVNDRLGWRKATSELWLRINPMFFPCFFI